MISLCILTRDNENLPKLIDMFRKHCPCEFEICLGDNSTNPSLIKRNLKLADEYIRISDKMLFRMGIPFAHNVINSIANTYKIFYIDADEYPVWIHPQIEDIFDTSYVISTLRFDFCSDKEIKEISNKRLAFKEILNLPILSNKDKVPQDRIYNSRYAKFDGNSHSIFHVPLHFRSQTSGVILLHNKEERGKKDKKRMDHLIDEQFAKANVNLMLASSEVVLGWGKGMKHRYSDWKEWVEAF